MKKILALALFYAVGAFAQSTSAPPPKYALYLTSDGGATWSPDASASGIAQVTAPPPRFTPYCTADGGMTWSQCTFGGGGGTPGGTSGQVQYNNAGAFGGFTPSGDCTINVTTGVVTCTKTNGVPFAPSATTDTTNASNITSGTLGAARLPGATTSTQGAIVLPPSGSFIVSNGSNSLITIKRFLTVSGAGDSYAAGIGVFAPTVDGYMAKLFRDTLADQSIPNFAVTSMPPYQIGQSLMKIYQPNPYGPNLLYLGEGGNAGIQDTCGGTVGTGCYLNAKFADIFNYAWGSVPWQLRTMASNGTTTGTCANDNTTMPVFQSTTFTAQGTPVSCTAVGSTVTIVVNDASSSATKAGFNYIVTNANATTGTVTLDGSPLTDQISNTTTFSFGGALGVNLASSSGVYPIANGPMRQQFTVTPSSSHTFVVTMASGTVMKIIGGDLIPPVGTYNANTVSVIGVPSPFANSALYNTLAIADVAVVTNAPATSGGSVTYTSLFSGIFFTNITADTATTATPQCLAAVSPGTATPAANHPNTCGTDDIESDVINQQIANGTIYTVNRGGGKSSGYTGQIARALNVTLTGLDRPNSFNKMNATNFNTAPVGMDLTSPTDQSGNSQLGGSGVVQTPSYPDTGMPWNNTANLGLFSAQNFGTQMGCYSIFNPTGTNNKTNLSTSYVRKLCIDSSGDIFMLGTVAQQVGADIASATTISPVAGITHITGTSAIQTINPIAPIFSSTTFGGCMTFIADGAWTTTTGGNIFAAMTASVGTPYQACYDGTRTKWYIK